MVEICRDSVMQTWRSLLLARRRVMDAVAGDLKAAGLPSIDLCHLLIQLTRTGHETMRPVELKERMELPQYTMSRLIERAVRAGYVVRQSCAADGRGVVVRATGRGHAAMGMIWPSYCAAIERHLGSRLCDVTAPQLGGLLDRLAAPPQTR